jgi:predicted nucleic acid-binding protein
VKSTIFDASSVINLVNGGVFVTCLALTTRAFYIGALVRGECVGCRDSVDLAVDQQRLIPLDGADLPASLFLELAQKYRLGDGETECLAFASIRPFDICCDDGRARSAVTTEVGPERLTGSLGLLREAMTMNLLDQESAFASYERMKQLGGFLPVLAKEFFRPLD